MNKIQIDRIIDSWLIYDIARKFEPDFEFTPQNKMLFKLFLAYFTGSNEFCELMYNYMKKTKQSPKMGSLDKGLYIIGNVGSGKSLIFKVFKEYTSIYRCNSYSRFDYLTILDKYESVSEDKSNLTGPNSLKKFGLNYIASGPGFKDNPSTVYIDDFGVRSFNAKSYGTEINMIDELIALRYLVFEKHQKLTHLSSNIYPSDFSDIMDERNKSRMFQMFNIIEFIDKDWRKEK